jgi:hypothetical protein
LDNPGQAGYCSAAKTFCRGSRGAVFVLKPEGIHRGADVVREQVAGQVRKFAFKQGQEVTAAEATIAVDQAPLDRDPSWQMASWVICDRHRHS